MGNGWPVVTIGEIAKVKGGKRLPIGKVVQDEKTAHPYIRVTDFHGGTLNTSEVKYIDDITFARVKRYIIASDDVFISIAGTIGLIGIVPQKFSGANLTENAAKITEIDRSVDQRFLAYYLRSPWGQAQIRAKTVGTSQPKLALFRIAEIEITLPPLPTQRKIADILSAYDDLIENNTRRIRILEEMAQMIYREWFVHFRFPGHEQVEMVETELGLVPERWRVTQIKDVVKRIAPGRIYTGSDVMDIGRVPVVDQSRSEYLGFHNEQPDLLASALAPILVFGDHTCKLQLMVQPFSIGPNLVPFVGMNGIPTHYLRYLADGLVRTREYKRHWTEFMIMRVVVAPSELSTSFSEIVTPMLTAMDTLATKNLVLRRTRDLLLPKLVSGEVDVGGLDGITIPVS